MLQDFKDFINRGNVVDLAVAVVLASFFAPIVTSIVDGIVLQVVALVFDQPNFDGLTIDISDTPFYYGQVLSAIFSFVVVAFVVFLIVKAYNRFKNAPDAAPDQIQLLTEIRDEIRRASQG